MPWAAVSGDEADQSASASRSGSCIGPGAALAAGRLSVVDATNPTRRPAPLVQRARASVPVAAIVLDLPPAVVHARNAGRARVVDRDVVDRHLALSGARSITIDWRRRASMRSSSCAHRRMSRHSPSRDVCPNGQAPNAPISAIAMPARTMPTACSRVTRSRSTTAARTTVATGYSDDSTDAIASGPVCTASM